MALDDRERMRAYYDALGEGEWSRLEDSPRGRVAFEVHRQFLDRFVVPGDHVLEIGAGPGRFTFELARLGATVEVTDFSPVQLELNRQHLEGTAADKSVASRSLLDICDTSHYADATFDVVLATAGHSPTPSKMAKKRLPGCCASPNQGASSSARSCRGWAHGDTFFPLPSSTRRSWVKKRLT